MKEEMTSAEMMKYIDELEVQLASCTKTLAMLRKALEQEPTRTASGKAPSERVTFYRLADGEQAHVPQAVTKAAKPDVSKAPKPAPEEGFIIKEINGETVLTMCRRSDEHIYVPKGVTVIGEKAFANRQSIKRVTIPNTVKVIGGSAFLNCYSLLTITIPKSVRSIENSAFEACENLAKVSLPEGAVKLGSKAFYGCTSLDSITIPKSVDEIGQYAFSYCPNIVIYCHRGSCAHDYAVRNKKSIVLI